MNPRVFREYDIRGVAESDFPDDFVTDLGRATGAEFFEEVVSAGDLVVGDDAGGEIALNAGAGESSGVALEELVRCAPLFGDGDHAG